MNQLAYIRRKIFRVPQRRFAAIAGSTQASVSRWETGDLEPDRGQLAAIRQAVLASGLPWNDAWFFETPGRPQHKEPQNAPDAQSADR